MSEKRAENIGKNAITNAGEFAVHALGAERMAKAFDAAKARAQVVRNAAQACQAAGLPWEDAAQLATDLLGVAEVLEDWLLWAGAPAAVAPAAVAPAAVAPAPAAPSVRPADLVRVPELPTPAPKAPEVLQLRKATAPAPQAPAPKAEPEPSTGKFTPGEKAIWVKDKTSAPQVPAAPAAPQAPAADEEERRLRKLEARRARRAARKERVG